MKVKLMVLEILFLSQLVMDVEDVFRLFKFIFIVVIGIIVGGVVYINIVEYFVRMEFDDG